jgi:hypothetical protein
MGPWVLWLQSSGFNDGLVGGFLLRRIDSGTQVDPRCVPVTGSTELSILPTRLSLAMSRQQAIRLLGAPRESRGPLDLFVRERRRDEGHGVFIELESIAIAVRSGVLETIEAWKSTSHE